MIKYITKTTKEYVYDSQGRLSKEVITEEYHEEPIGTLPAKSTTTTDIKKAVGVPNGGTITNPPWTATVSYDTIPKRAPLESSQADTNGITHSNITVNTNVTESINTEELTKAVKKAIDKANKLNGLANGFKF